MKTGKIKSFIVLAVFILLVVAFAHHAKADCSIVWKPGDTTVLRAGHHVTFIVESEDVPAFVKQHGTDKDLMGELSTSSTKVHYCGDYEDIEDKDLD
jgi:hypothetical protein